MLSMNSITHISRRILAVLTALIALAAMSAPLASAHGTAKTQMENISLSDHTLSGYVVSSKEGCTSNRKVVMYKMLSSHRNPGHDRKVGANRATPNGDGAQFFITTTGTGHFYAYAPAIKGCSSAISFSVQITA
jgi:hypothetical protein